MNLFCFQVKGNGSAHYEHVFHSAHVRRRDKTCVRQITLTLGVFLREDVAFESVLTLDLARAGHLEALLGAGVGFLFRHCIDY